MEEIDLRPGKIPPLEFLELDARLARANPLVAVVPRALSEALFTSANPYWSHGKARAFWSNERGRAIGFFHPEPAVDGRPVAFFGYWATVNDLASNLELFDHLGRWALDLGAEHLIGPVNFKTAYDYRLRLDDFEAPAFWGEPTNPAYYVQLLEDMGFDLCQSYVTEYILKLEELRPFARKKLGRLQLDADGARFLPFSPENVEARRREILELANRLFATNRAFHKLDPFDINLLYRPETIRRACPETSFLLVDNEDRLRGLSFNFAHPFDPRCLLVKTIGIDPEFRAAGRSFAATLERLFERSKNYDRMAFCLMTNENQVHRLTRRYAEKQRRYGLFRRALRAT